MDSSSPEAPKSLFELSANDIDGNSQSLADLAKDYKAILIVNVASKCGLTKGHYEQLTEIHDKFSDKGFQIFAFPCNQFGAQEPGTNEEIRAFAQDKYGAKFQLFDKIDVNGEDTHSVFTFCKRNSSLHDSSTETTGDIPWNFAKFLINSDGEVVEYFDPEKQPEECIPKIEELLG
ncbi:unnamed protein product [Moneuplotes crassus]|uniref:Glutathione peroxidase n=1 Tax=Euplotes crassus TaxID=5936 RepID=A0AAD1Y1W7_EUPCR|nr:unnamed protein product [Moneuplotes crassus]